LVIPDGLAHALAMDTDVPVADRLDELANHLRETVFFQCDDLC
jgi:hypothetical protein